MAQHIRSSERTKHPCLITRRKYDQGSEKHEVQCISRSQCAVPFVSVCGYLFSSGEGKALAVAFAQWPQSSRGIGSELTFMTHDCLVRSRCGLRNVFQTRVLQPLSQKRTERYWSVSCCSTIVYTIDCWDGGISDVHWTYETQEMCSLFFSLSSR